MQYEPDTLKNTTPRRKRRGIYAFLSLALREHGNRGTMCFFLKPVASDRK